MSSAPENPLPPSRIDPDKAVDPDKIDPPLKIVPPARRNSSFSMIGVAVILMLIAMWYFNKGDQVSEITYGFFRTQLAAGKIETVEMQGQRITGEFTEPPVDPLGKKDRNDQPIKLNKKFGLTVPPLVGEKLDELMYSKLSDKNKYSASIPPDSAMIMYAVSTLVVLLVVMGGMMLFFRRTRDSIFGGGIFGSFSKSPARRYVAGERRVKFDDVAGLDGAKRELLEIVEFLKTPKKFQRLGGQVPKGILLMGPPGTGKTLLGRAVAGEADVPFFSINGSEFIQMFAGVGASRVRDLFDTAKQNAPCILFIDEIDAVGRHRGTGVGAGHDEREQTLNQILSEMDGFTQTETVIVMAATNRPDVLDPALLRPGRFDRHVSVDRPTVKGRLAIFKVHTRNIPLAPNVDLQRLAAGTVGLTGADIRNLVNEATLWASRQDKEVVEMLDFEYARDKVLMGAKREEVLIGKEKTMTACHEAGHALLAWLVPEVDPLHSVSIIPRGMALGVTQLLPEEDRLNIGESQLYARLAFIMGGRAAEKLVFNEFSAGAEDDLNRATQMARRMVTHWGMSDRLGPVAFRDTEDHPFLGREIAEPRRFSEHTAQTIDEEVVRILRAAFEKATEMLTDQRDKLDTLTKALEQEESLDHEAIAKLLGPSARHLGNGK